VKIRRQDRGLLFVCSIVDGGNERLRWLYQFAEASGELLANALLSRKYREIVKLTGDGVTSSAFISTLHRMGMNPSLAAIDVIMMVHGLPGKLCFQDRDAPTVEIAKTIVQLGVQPKLRLYYSTACFGATHNDDLLAAGFDAAIGAVGENCNAATEYPTLLTLWGAGRPINDALVSAEPVFTRVAADTMARALGFKKANSEKVLAGSRRVKIDRL